MEAGVATRSRIWVPRHHQLPPPDPWDTWALIGGRGCGKTDAGAYYVSEHVKGPPCLAGAQPHRVGIVAPTLGDAVEACVNGPSGLKAHDPTARMVQGIGGAYVRWPNGSEAKLFGAYTPEDVERFRAGGNRCLMWLEEFAAWRLIEQVLEQIDFGLRIGPHPRKVLTSTPKPKKALLTVLADPGTKRTYTEDGRIPTMDDNPDLPETVRTTLTRKYAATRLGKQELKGELLSDVPGAYWQWATIERNRVAVAGALPGDTEPRAPLGTPSLVRVVIPVDPAATSTEDSDETGIVVCGKAMIPGHPIARPDIPGMDQIHPPAPHAHYYVLEDVSLRGSPTEWATAAVRAFDRHAADRIIGETNNGGDMVESTIRTVRSTVPYRKVTASKGKAVRAEPISGLYEQDLVHHVGPPADLAALEDQLTTYTGPDSIEHDDRLDSVVYGITELQTTGLVVLATTVHHGPGPQYGSGRRSVRGYRNPRGD